MHNKINNSFTKHIIYSEENINVNGEFVKTIDFSKYAEGIYFLVIESGNKVATEKIVIQK